jgi:hypothetical protein
MHSQQTEPILKTSIPESSGINIDVIELFADAPDRNTAPKIAKRDGQWEVIKSDRESGIDTLRIKSAQDISIEQFKFDNPGIDPTKFDTEQKYKLKTYQSRVEDGWQLESINKNGTVHLF